MHYIVVRLYDAQCWSQINVKAIAFPLTVTHTVKSAVALFHLLSHSSIISPGYIPIVYLTFISLCAYYILFLRNGTMTELPTQVSVAAGFLVTI